MPETKRGPSERAEFVIAVVVAAVIMTGAYLVADPLPFPIAVVLVLLAALGLTALATSLAGGRR
ncbi:hypothetical protein [Streptomyces sp. NPDC017529]|uniref:hypothetical protein n=1 Tax=Streptomyces sp. NPDC017529 TaxID=3365000 RepID=UPI003798114F